MQNFKIGDQINTLPSNDPSSSIMPGKVNPTQSEALTMVCAQVMGNHTTILITGAQGLFILNAFKPVIAYIILQSIRLLSYAAISFSANCIAGITLNIKRISYYLDQSLMMVTVLAPKIGYDNAAKITKEVMMKWNTLKEKRLKFGLLSEDGFDQIVDPKK